MRLAIRPRDLITIAENADSYGISEHHLTKVVHKLGVAGYIGTVRGRNGRIRLLKRAGDTNLGEIVPGASLILSWRRVLLRPMRASSNLPACSRSSWPMRAMRSSPRSNITLSPSPSIKLKRAYEPASRTDGTCSPWIVCGHAA
jgi:hypothetical protein